QCCYFFSNKTIAMNISKEKIGEHNQPLLKEHRRKLDFISSEIKNGEDIIKKLVAFQVAIPSWALGSGGTRFGRFSIGGEPRNLQEKIEDIGLIHALNQSSNSISLHIPWDIPKDIAAVKESLLANHLIIDSVNSNTFQDQTRQEHSY